MEHSTQNLVAVGTSSELKVRPISEGVIFHTSIIKKLTQAVEVVGVQIEQERPHWYSTHILVQVFEPVNPPGSEGAPSSSCR